MGIARISTVLTLVSLAVFSGCAAENDGSALPGSAGMVKGGDGRTGEYGRRRGMVEGRA